MSAIHTNTKSDELIDSQKNVLINHNGVNCFLHLQPSIIFHNLHLQKSDSLIAQKWHWTNWCI